MWQLFYDIIGKNTARQQQLNLLRIRQKKKTGITPANNNTLDTKVVVSLKCLSNF